MSQRELESSIYLNLSDTLSYGDYLKLDQVLSAQAPLSRPPHHDEMLFIIQHQTSELWMKLMIHELTAVLADVRADRIEASFKKLARVGQIQRMLFEQWSVLETLTPSEYLEFRNSLGKSSGFQSYQYRMIEFLLGNKDENMLRPHEHRPELHAELKRVLHQPSLYEEFLKFLARSGHDVPADVLERDWSKPRERDERIVQVFKRIYENTERFWNEYEMAEKLIDVEQRFQLWRFRHMMTVQRVIGFKKGTGGSSGVGFLKKALDQTFFPELWDVRTCLG
jgi:tryptophan 2,3-dioxygenase